VAILDKVSELLEWNNRDKARVVAAVGLSLAILFSGWAFITLHYTEFGKNYFDQDYAQLIIKLQLLAAGFWLIMLAIGSLLQRKERNPLWFPVVILIAYPAFLVPAGWMYGWVTLSAGLILVGSYLVGIVLWDLHLARFSVAVPSVLFGAMIVLTLTGDIPFAPLFKTHPLAGDTPSTYFLISDLMLSLPFMSVCTLTGLMMIINWRAREESIRYLSMTDELTSVANRRAILNTLEHELARSKRNQKPVSLAILDLDHFKQVNDNHGHDSGDLVLQEAAKRLEGSIRGADWLGRYGGEEFLLVMPETKAEEAWHVLERCRRKMADEPVILADGTALAITASFGFCENSSKGISAEKILQLADQALYQAKHDGRNRVQQWLGK
jgi:diguanylate cyclase (GGDEF)-like protein